MIFYILIFLLLVAIVILKIKANSFILALWMLFFIALVGLRDQSVGTDTINYIIMYDELEDGYHGYPEPIYGLIGHLFSYFRYPFYYFQLFLCLISFSFVFTVIKKQKDGLFSVFILYSLYFICYAMNINREMIAAFIVLYSYHFLLNSNTKNNLLFVIFLFIASGFHLSAIFLLSLVFINRLNLSTKAIFLFLFMSLIIGFLIPIDSFLPIVGKYADTLMEDENVRDSSKILKGVLLSIFFMVEFVYINIKTKFVLINHIYMKIFVIGLFLSNILVRQNYGIRLFLYFNIVQILLLPLVIDSYKGNKHKFEIFLILYLSIYFLTMIVTNSADVVPYSLV